MTRPGVGHAGRFEHPDGAHGVEGDALDRAAKMSFTSAMAARWKMASAPRTASVRRSWSSTSTSAQSASTALGRPRVEDPHAVTGVEQRVDDVRADEARPSGDGDGLRLERGLLRHSRSSADPNGRR